MWRDEEERMFLTNCRCRAYFAETVSFFRVLRRRGTVPALQRQKKKKFGQGNLFEVVNSIFLNKGPPAGESSRGLGAPRTLPFLNGGLRPQSGAIIFVLPE